MREREREREHTITILQSTIRYIIKLIFISTSDAAFLLQSLKI